MNANRIIAGLLFGLVTCTGNAAPVTFYFTGTVIAASEIFAGQGSMVTGSYTYDTSLVDVDSGNATLDTFFNNNPPENQGFTDVFDITVTVGAITRSTSDNQIDETLFAYSVFWLDSSNADNFGIIAQPQDLTTDDGAIIALSDPAPPEPDAIAEGNGNLNDTPMTTAPNVPKFSLRNGSEYVTASEGEVSFTIDTITTTVTDITLDIKPGDDPNSISLKSRGFVPVAILTTDIFDASTVNPSSVEFGPDGARVSDTGAHFDDVDFDGDADLVLRYQTQDTGIACGDTSASLTGMTFAREPIVGSDSVNTVGCK